MPRELLDTEELRSDFELAHNTTSCNWNIGDKIPDMLDEIDFLKRALKNIAIQESTMMCIRIANNALKGID